MTRIATTSEGPWKPEELLGGLNDVECRFAPAEIFTRGRTALLQQAPRVAIVGARDATEEGIRRARKLTNLVIDVGGVVVSGLAKGIDVAAHSAAMERNGATIGVLGTGLDQSYPFENRSLQERIGREHLLVTQFAEGSWTQKGNFVRRNRLMALIVDGSIIVEASDSSGTLSQGWEMIRLGRPLFILRSLLHRSDLEWPKQMLQHGAIVLNEPRELQEWLAERSGSADAASF